ncbi:8-oxo-dGTP diphosphatase [Rhizina undulata]
MGALTPASAQALVRLKAYVHPRTAYLALPTSSRAAVLVLLFADPSGDLMVLLTLRSAMLRSFAGQVALPGGKADTPSETPLQTSRREAFEEIGLPLDNGLPGSFAVEHLTELPCSLAQTNLGVRPCVAFLNVNSRDRGAEVKDTFIPRLDPNEVKSVFTVPLEKFLMRHYDKDGSAEKRDGVEWYDGKWLPLNGTRWRSHEFQAPVHENGMFRRHRVWGMTARILVEVARIAYGRDPDFQFDEAMGDEEMIWSLLEAGKFPDKKKDGADVQTGEGTTKGNL